MFPFGLLVKRLLRYTIVYIDQNVTMSSTVYKSINQLSFENRVLQNLPIDPVQDNYVRTVNGACFSLVKPTPLKSPKIVCFSSSALRLLDLNEESIDDDFIQCFAGNKIIDGSEPAAHCYCGHQFGSFAGQLGDGAAIYLGEIINLKNERWELQLKGAGSTPYSREADGRKVLRSSLREFLCSEAMYHLGIPTTRAATCIVAEDTVVRDMFYDGHSKMENCSVVSRIAPSFIRFGSFEIFKPIDHKTGRIGPSVGRHDILTNLTDFVISSLFNSIDQLDVTQTEKYKLFYKDVVIKTAKLVAQWESVGFCHGVLNTDNMSILGLTLDCGPFGFLDRFDPDHIPNTSDTEGRYCFRQQAEMCCWNLLKFAEALNPLVPTDELKTILSENYYSTFKSDYFDKMLNKLGLFKKIENEDEEGTLPSDEKLITEFLETMANVGGDYTNCFRKLNIATLPKMADFDQSVANLKLELMKQSSSLDEMIDYYESYVNSPMVYMRLILLRNFGDQMMNDEKTVTILSKLRHYEHLKELDETQFSEECDKYWSSWIEMYVERLKFEINDLGNNLEELVNLNQQRKIIMNQNNPIYILRNYLAENAINKAETGDFSEAKMLLNALENPYTEKVEYEKYMHKPPKSACKLMVSCSS